MGRRESGIEVSGGGVINEGVFQDRDESKVLRPKTDFTTSDSVYSCLSETLSHTWTEV